MVRTQAFRPVRADWLQAAAVFLALFLLYASTAPRTVAVEDDGLFVLSSYFLGIEHPPGFPLFTLLGKLFTYLPFGSVAYRVHLASAFFGGLSGAAAWMCARSLLEARLPALLAALALGLSPAFWSQAIIADVYTLNTFFFLLLTYLGLQACPAEGPGPQTAGLLSWIALLYGLSLSNHWPLMVLAAPGFALLLWPARREALQCLPTLVLMVAAGLLPYAWMVANSWSGLMISFYGPLESLAEVWYFVSRAGYGDVDVSPGAGWLDRLKFFQFVGVQLAVQFAVLGTALAAAGFWVQWRLLGTRLSAFLTVAFLMPTVGLLLLLGFSYDAYSKHVFHVYPLPAYAVAALWMGLGLVWVAQRLALRPAHAAAGAMAVLAVIAAVAGRDNLRARDDWAARYAQAVLGTLPPDAALFIKGDLDVGSIGYFHIVEGVRPDITLYQSKGLVLGNRLFHPLRTRQADADRTLVRFVDEHGAAVAFTSEFAGQYAKRDRWLTVQVDRSSTDIQQITVDIPDHALRFLEESVLGHEPVNPWVAFYQHELLRRYAGLLGQTLQRGEPLDDRRKRHLERLSNTFHGALGLAEGLMASRKGYAAGVVYGFLNRARELMPSDVPMVYLEKFFYLRGLLRLDVGEERPAIDDLRAAVSVRPTSDNAALAPLRDLYLKTGDKASLDALETRIRRRAP